MSKGSHPFERAHSIGPKMVRLLALIDVTNFDQLRGADEKELALRINIELGGKHINAMGVRALKNLIELAKMQTK